MELKRQVVVPGSYQGSPVTDNFCPGSPLIIVVTLFSMEQLR